MYIVGDEKISGEFRLYFDYLSEDSNDFIGYRGLKILFRRPWIIWVPNPLDFDFWVTAQLPPWVGSNYPVPKSGFYVI
jgi:hypothetical protein